MEIFLQRNTEFYIFFYIEPDRIKSPVNIGNLVINSM